jgi:hypothetical protein
MKIVLELSSDQLFELQGALYLAQVDAHTFIREYQKLDKQEFVEVWDRILSKRKDLAQIIEGAVDEAVARLALSGDPFVDAAGGDFRLKASAREALGSGWPGAFLRNGALTAWAGHPVYGAVQQAVRPVGLLRTET